MSAAGVIIESMLAQPEVIPEMSCLLKLEHFPDSDHRKIFSLIQKRSQEGQEIDISLILSDLADEMPLDKAQDLLARLNAGNSLTRNLKANVAKLLREHERSQTRAALEAALSTISDKRTDPSAVWEALLEKGVSLQADKPEPHVYTAEDAARSFLNTLALERKHTGELHGLSTGVPGLDEITGGFGKGEFHIYGGLPGRCKTAAALQALAANAKAGHPVLFFSVEMTHTEVMRRLCGAPSVGATASRRVSYLSDAKYNKLIEYTAGEVAKWPVTIVDSGELTPGQVASRARLEIRRRGIELVIVDYLQLLNGPGKELRERVGHCANALRQLAKSTQVPVLCLSQLRRPSSGLNERPSMIELRESGEIEAHAHCVILTYQPITDKGEMTGEDELIVGKNRNGVLGSVPVTFNRYSLTFQPRTYERKQ
jgi:replicative DNA helicase